jgi:hypothetical protein
MGRNPSTTGEYAEILTEVIPLVSSKNRHPRLADYERAVANLLNTTRPLVDELYSSRGVHTQVRRAMLHLLKEKKVIKIGKCFYPAMENQYYRYELLSKHIRFAKPSIHIISHASFAVAIEPGQDTNEIKSAITAFVCPKFLFGVFLQDDIALILVNPETPKDIIAHFAEAVRDAYDSQHPSLEKKS